MKRSERIKLIEDIHELMSKSNWLDLALILSDTKHENGMYALCLLRSSYSEKDKYWRSWYKQLKYAKTLLSEGTLIGLDLFDVDE